MGINQKIVTLRSQLVDAVNASGLPACVCSLIVDQIAAQLQSLAKNDLAHERAEDEAEEAKDGGQSV